MSAKGLKRIAKRCCWGFVYYRSAARLLKLINRENDDPDYRYTFLHTLETLFRNLASKDVSFSRTTEDSLKGYEAYDDREIRMLEDKVQVIRNGSEVVTMTFAEARKERLKYLFESVDELIKNGDTKKIRILEVGCGNLMNAVLTKEKYGDSVEYHGIDISPNRIRIGLEHFPELEKENYSASSITEKTSFEDGEFDIVFSMHCLEQISYETKAALKEMYRICKKRIVMVEPVYENGSFLQRTYLLALDITRILMKSIKELGYEVIDNRVCDVQSNLYNQSSIVVVRKS